MSDESWAAEYLETDQNVIDWSADYLQENTATLSGPDPLMLADQTLSLRGPLLPPEDTVALRGGEGDPVLAGGDGDQLWAEQYLTDVPSLSDSALDSQPLTASQQIGQSSVSTSISTQFPPWLTIPISLSLTGEKQTLKH